MRSARTGFPRSRGDTPAGRNSARRLIGVPPLARGYTRCRPSGRAGGPGSPARAGIHPTLPRWPKSRSRFPRSRGDTPLNGMEPVSVDQVPPLARGYTRGLQHRSHPTAGSPARAGIHPASVASGSCDCRFPRSRGDTPAGAYKIAGARRVPPLARGYTPLSPSPCASSAGSPARAGIHP